MKKAVVFLLLLVPLMAWSGDFGSGVDFSLELSNLSNADTARSAAEDGRVAVLEGVAGPVIQIDGESWLRIIGGEWIGTEEVRGYSCLVRVADTQWHNAFPPETSDNVNSDSVGTGSRILVAAEVLGWSDEYEEPIVEMVGYRVLK